MKDKNQKGITRRQFTTTMSAGILALTLLDPKLGMGSTPKNYVLVHGSWHGAWVYKKVILY